MVQGTCNSQDTLYIDQKLTLLELNAILWWKKYLGQDEICTEGQVISCLADGADSTDRRDTGVEPRLLNLPKHKQ